MNIAKRLFFLIAAVALLVSFNTVTQPLRAQAASPGVRVIEVTAKKYEYNPSTIRVKKGTKVELKIRALDKTHGFKISQYPDGSDGKGAPGLVFNDFQDGWKVEKDSDTVIDFTANEPGTYTFKCSNFCGFGHLHMKGELVVEP